MKFKAQKISSAQYNFKSKLELECAEILDEANLKWEYEPYRVTLLKSFELEKDMAWEGTARKLRHVRKVRPITYTPDFVGVNWVIETKGYFTEDAKLKWKLFKRKVLDTKLYPLLFLVRNKTQIRKAVELILNNSKDYDEGLYLNGSNAAILRLK